MITEAFTRGVLWKKVFLEISQNSQENTCARVSFNFLWLLGNFWEHILYRTPLEAASVIREIYNVLQLPFPLTFDYFCFFLKIDINSKMFLLASDLRTILWRQKALRAANVMRKILPKDLKLHYVYCLF